MHTNFSSFEGQFIILCGLEIIQGSSLFLFFLGTTIWRCRNWWGSCRCRKKGKFNNWDLIQSDTGYILNRTYLIKAYFLPAAAFPYKELAEGYKEADDVVVEVLDDDVWPLDSCNDCIKINSFRRKLVKLMEYFHTTIWKVLTNWIALAISSSSCWLDTTLGSFGRDWLFLGWSDAAVDKKGYKFFSWK